MANGTNPKEGNENSNPSDEELTQIREKAILYEGVQDAIPRIVEKKEEVARQIEQIRSECREQCEKVCGNNWEKSIQRLDLEEERDKQIENVERESSIENINIPELREMLMESGVLEAVRKAIAQINENLQKQRHLNLVGHYWDSTKKGFVKELKGGEKLAIEKDARSTLDGRVVFSHSKKMEPKRQGRVGFSFSGKIINFSTLEELQEMESDILTLEDALEEFSPYAKEHKFVIDVKDEGVVNCLLKLLEARDKENPGEKISESLVIACTSPRIIQAFMDSRFKFGGFNLENNPFGVAELPDEESSTLTKGLNRFWDAFGRIKKAIGPTIGKTGMVDIVVAEGSEGKEFPDVEESPEMEGIGKEVIQYVFLKVPEKFLERLKRENSSIEIQKRVLVLSSLAGVVSDKVAKRIIENGLTQMKRIGNKKPSIMFVTFGEQLMGETLGLQSFTAGEQIRRITEVNEELGEDIVLYTAQPAPYAKEPEAVTAEKVLKFPSGKGLVLYTEMPKDVIEYLEAAA